MNFHFLRPEWFIAFIPLGIILFVLYKKHQNNSSWRQWIAPHLAEALLIKQQHIKKKHIGLLTSIWIICVIALAGPTWHKVNVPVSSQDAGRVILFDLSMSMLATDMTPNRLTQAKYKLTDLLDNFKEGKTGLVAYAGDAFVLSPLTEDHQTLLHLIPALRPEIMPVTGSNPVAAVKKGIEIIKQSGHQKGDLIWITDGIDAEDISQFKEAMLPNFRLIIYAFGSEDGAPIQFGEGQLMKQENQVVLAKTNFQQLNQLASQFQGKLIRAQMAENHWLDIIELVREPSEFKLQEQQGVIWQDMGGYFALLLILPLLYAFRQGHLLVMFLGFTWMITAPSPSHASIWKNDHQNALDAYHQQDFSTSAKLANKGSQLKAAALYNEGNYKEAAKIWQSMHLPRDHYNAGNAYLKAQMFDAAIEQYTNVLENEPQFSEAKDNRELAKRLKEEAENKKNEQEKQDNAQNKNKQQKNEQEKQDNAQNKNKQQKSEQQENAQNKNEQQKSKQQENAQNKNEQQKSEQQENAPTNNEQQENNQDQFAQSTDNTEKQDMPVELKRILQQTSDDPTVLLKNKMKLEYLKRQQQGHVHKEQSPW